MVDTALKEQLQRDVEAIRCEMAEAWKRPVSPNVMNFFYYGEGKPGPRFPDKWPDGWGDMLSETVEVRFYQAFRALQLVEFGLDPIAHSFGFQTTIKSQPSGLGILLIFTFYDMLAVISGCFAYDAVFMPEPYAEFTRAFADPEGAIRDWRRWKSKRRDIESPPSQRSSKMQNEESPKTKFKRLLYALYPSMALREAARERWRNRKLTPIEVQAMVRKLSGEPEPERPSIEEQVLFMDLDAMTPLAALEHLRKLQAQARSNAP